jgi:hypothetical protein
MIEKIFIKIKSIIINIIATDVSPVAHPSSGLKI